MHYGARCIGQMRNRNAGLDDLLGGGLPKITGQGIQVGEPLEQFQGVLTGVPTYFGKSDQILTPDAGRKPKLS
jgi:hypothetical protein